MPTNTTAPAGYVLYAGPSRLDPGVPIICVATMSSGNEKTGDMAQTWIMLADTTPTDAVRTGADQAICGSCAHRPSRAAETLEAPCYVEAAKAPTSVWHAYHRGIYPRADVRFTQALASRMVRLGSYGDPAALPTHTIMGVAMHARGWTGYTQQWRIRPSLRGFLMASVSTPEDAYEAQALGWRTFRTMRPDEAPSSAEFICPASPEGGDRMKCVQCLACNGAPTGNRRASPVIVEHGSGLRRVIRLRADRSLGERGASTHTTHEVAT